MVIPMSTRCSQCGSGRSRFGGRIRARGSDSCLGNSPWTVHNAAHSEVNVMHTSGYFRSLVALGLLLGVTSARANAQGPFLTVCRDGTVWSLNRAGICGERESGEEGRQGDREDRPQALTRMARGLADVPLRARGCQYCRCRATNV